MACPLRVHDFHPEVYFSFKHKFLQEFLATLHLYQKLTEGNAMTQLSSVALADDSSILRFFGDVCVRQLESCAAEAASVQKHLLDGVLLSQGSGDATVARGASNAIGLLNASRVSLAGMN